MTGMLIEFGPSAPKLMKWSWKSFSMVSENNGNSEKTAKNSVGKVVSHLRPKRVI